MKKLPMVKTGFASKSGLVHPKTYTGVDEYGVALNGLKPHILLE